MKTNMQKEELQKQAKLDAEYVLKFNLLERPSLRYKDQECNHEYEKSFWLWFGYLKLNGVQ